MAQTENDRAVQRAAFDLYGRNMIDTIQRVDSDVWRITMKDGGISRATIQDDGSICIDPE